MLVRTVGCALILGCLSLCLGLRTLTAQEMRYDLKPEQKFSYSVTITVDEDEKVTTFRGNIHYTVQSANAEQIKLTYRGGLNESSQNKQSRRGNEGPFGGFPSGPRMMGPRMMGPPSPFQRPAFAGKVQTTNRIIMSPTGRVLSMEGDSQLPFLLGNVSLLPFETLPKAGEREWVLDSGVSISESNEDQRPFGAPIPFGPRGFGSNSDKVVQAATEITRYSIASQDGDLVQVNRTNQLTSPAADQESFDMNGSGVWTFNLKDHVPQSLDMTTKLTVKEGNSSTTFPITIKYERLSDEALAKMEEDVRLAQEEAKRRADEEKAKATTPLTPSEKQQMLAALTGESIEQTKQTLSELEKKSLEDTDEQITAAIESLLGHKDKNVAGAARKALAKWSSAFAKREALRKAYDGPGVVASSDREVESSTPLYVGQLLQAQEHGSFWHPVRIKSLLPGGKVEVEFMQWGKPGRSVTLMRRNLQLAPEELEQPDRPAATSQSSSTSTSLVSNSAGDLQAMRTWSDASGRFKIEAKYEGVINGQVRLKRADGREVNVPLEKLSPADRAHVKQIEDNAENPFEPK